MEIAVDALDEVRLVARSYFIGLYTADVELLRSIFHVTATLQAPNLRLTRDEWLDRVASRPVPSNADSSRGFKILATDVGTRLAMMKLRCPLFQFCYTDFLTLLKEDGRWLIVNKTYADCPDWQIA